MSDLAVATLSDGRLQTFYVDDAGVLWSRWQVSGEPPDVWQPKTKVDPSPGIVTNVAVTTTPQGDVTVLVTRRDGTYVVSVKLGPDPNAGWSDWQVI